MRLFKARNLTVEAMQYDGTNRAAMEQWCNDSCDLLCPGEWLVKLHGDRTVIFAPTELSALFEPIMSASIHQ